MASGFDPAERVRLIHAMLRDELRKGKYVTIKITLLVGLQLVWHI